MGRSSFFVCATGSIPEKGREFVNKVETLRDFLALPLESTADFLYNASLSGQTPAQAFETQRED